MRIRIYTDGACSSNPGPGGWGIVINTSIKNIKKSGGEVSTTNNRMELRAVIEAYKEILKRTKPGADIQFDIFSDSAYVVNTINNSWVEAWSCNGWQTVKGNDVKNRDLWEEFQNLRKEVRKRGISVIIHKIKGHDGNTFNELADELAKAESIKLKEGEVNE